MLEKRVPLGYLLRMTTAALPLFDILTPFMLEGVGVRGRVVRLGPVADTILARYDYPPFVAAMLGELLLAASMLSANLKEGGIFTLQVRGQGPVPLMVVDAVHGGQLRGFADVSADARADIMGMKDYSPKALVGEGAYLAITLDAGQAYFTNSEQLQVMVQFALAGNDGHWRAGGIMVERMPDAPGSEHVQEAWDYARAVTNTVSDAELLDPLLDAPALLYRLFHEQGVWVHDPQSLATGCRCSRERILGILTGMPLEDRAEMVVDGQIDVHCQFCNKTEVFTPADIGLSAGN